MLSAVCGTQSTGLTDGNHPIFPCAQPGGVCRALNSGQAVTKEAPARGGAEGGSAGRGGPKSCRLVPKQGLEENNSSWQSWHVTPQELYGWLAAGKEAELKPGTAEPPQPTLPGVGVVPNHLQNPPKSCC